jgi:hypothetical protein
MATLSGYHEGDGQIVWTISNLGFQAHEYSNFWVRSGPSGGGTSYANWSDYSTSYSTTFSTYHSLGQTITGNGRFQRNGINYNCDPTGGVSIYLAPAIPPPTGIPSVSATASRVGNTNYINVYWSSVSGATSYKVYANDNNGSGDVLKDSNASYPSTQLP